MTYRKRNPLSAFFLNDWIPTWGGRRISVAEAMTPIVLLVLGLVIWYLS